MNDLTVITRANIMGGMNQDIIDLGDEVIYMKWIMVFPDGCDEDELMEMAEDEETYLEVVECYARCLKVAEGGK
jgi:DNA helicase IV